MDKKFWLKLDKNKIILQLKDLGKRFSLRRKTGRRTLLIIFLFSILIGVGYAIYNYDLPVEEGQESGVTVELDEVIPGGEDNPVSRSQEERGNAPEKETGDNNSVADKTEQEVNQTEQTTEKEVTAEVVKERPAEDVTETPAEEIKKTDTEEELNQPVMAERQEETAPTQETGSREAKYPANKDQTQEPAQGVITEPVRPVVEQETEAGLSLLKPVSGELVQEPGWFFHPVFEDWRYNYGVEFAGNPGDVVMAAAGGRIVSVSEDAYRGILVAIEHANGWLTRYGHLQRTVVSPGEVVARGQEIGHLGTTGITGEPSLYFELQNRESNIDPVEYFE